MNNQPASTMVKPPAKTKPNFRPWIGVDLDGTLAMYNGYLGPKHIGEPIPVMVDRVKTWLSEGKEVRIMTARAYQTPRGIGVIEAIEEWCRKHIGQVLPVTACKDYHMVELWDDRAVAVVANTGELV